MNLFGNGIRFGGAVAIGAAAVLLAPVILPVLAGVLRPIAKGVIKGGILAFEGARVAVAETKETLEDLAAEARSELTQEQKQAAKSKKQAA